MFIVSWKSEPPEDKDDWIVVLREVMSGAGGSYRIWFYQGPKGWKFDFEWREDAAGDEGMLANSPDTLRFNLYQSLLARGKAMDPDWRTP
jgi:hypothetical protein